MKTINLNIIILITCLSFVSCKKDKAPLPTCTQVFEDNTPADTIYPSEYMPYYPGSWWDYSGDFFDTTYTMSEHSGDWVTVAFTETVPLENCTGIYKQNKVLVHNKIAGMYRFEPGATEEDASYLRQILDTIPGVFFHSYSQSSEYSLTTTIECVERIPSMVVNGVTFQDVLFIKSISAYHYYDVGGNPYYTTEEYYARNVGKIQTAWFYSGNPMGPTWKLTNYHIAPH